MKKIIILISAMLLMCSCSQYEKGYESTYNSGVTAKNVTRADGPYYIVELTYNGETHEFVEYEANYRHGITHWPGCKYCKEHNKTIE